MKAFLSAAAFFAVFMLAGCGNHVPELNQLYSQINFIMGPSDGKITSEFTVLVNVDDEDGDDDIDNINVIDDGNQLYWTIENGNWSERDNRGLKWFGSQRLSTADGSPPPPGEYRVVVTDRAGERADDTIFVSMIDDMPLKDDFPVIVFEEGGGLSIESPQNRNIISFYDAGGKLLAAYTVTTGFLDLGGIAEGASISENYRSCSIALYSNTVGAGLITGPYSRP